MKNELMNYNEDSLFDPLFDFFAPANFYEPKYVRGLAMKTDIKEDEKNYVMDVDLPGIDKKDIDISLNNGYLTIKAKANTDTGEKDKKGGFVHRERFSGTASRSYYVGDIDEKAIAATFANGVLTLTFPKENEKKEELEHRIAIK